MKPYFPAELVRNDFGNDKEKEIKYQKKLREKDLDSYNYILGNPKGRWFLRRFCGVAFFDVPTFTGNSHSFFNEGRRALALDVINDIKQSSYENHELVLLAELEELKFKEELSHTIKNQKRGDIEDE